MNTVYTLAIVGGSPRFIRGGVSIVEGRRDLDRGLAQVIVREAVHTPVEWGRASESDRRALAAEIERLHAAQNRRRLTVRSVVCTPTCRTPGCAGTATTARLQDLAPFCLKCRNRIQAKAAKLRAKGLPVPPLPDLMAWMLDNARARVASGATVTVEPTPVELPSAPLLERALVELLVLAAQFGGVPELRAAALRGRID